jgi:hypothetical protein
MSRVVPTNHLYNVTFWCRAAGANPNNCSWKIRIGTTDTEFFPVSLTWVKVVAYGVVGSSNAEIQIRVQSSISPTEQYLLYIDDMVIWRADNYAAPPNNIGIDFCYALQNPTGTSTPTRYWEKSTDWTAFIAPYPTTTGAIRSVGTNPYAINLRLAFNAIQVPMVETTLSSTLPTNPNA